MRDTSYTLNRLPELKQLEETGEMMSDKEYEVSTHEKQQEFAKQRNDPWDEWKPSKDIA